MKTFFRSSVSTVIAACSVLAGAGRCQTTPRELIDFLTYQSGRQYSQFKRESEMRRDRSAARALASLGTSAIPDLRVALGSIERGSTTQRGLFNARWLLFADAAIEGRDAFPDLRRMLDNSRLELSKGDLDTALAIALGLTAYVSGYEKVESAVCCLMPEPRDALAGFISAWERNDQASMVSHLYPGTGPVAAEGLSDEFPPGPAGSQVSVGFHFETAARWAEPPETLDQGLQDLRQFVNLEQVPRSLESETRFTDRVGRDCGRRRLKFRQRSPSSGLSPPEYLIDDPDFRSIIRLIAGCATQ